MKYMDAYAHVSEHGHQSRTSQTHSFDKKNITIVKISIILSLCVNKISKRRKDVYTSNQKWSPPMLPPLLDNVVTTYYD
jgi:hypothetical protein